MKLDPVNCRVRDDTSSSSRQQAAGSKQQAASSKQQAAGSRQQAASSIKPRIIHNGEYEVMYAYIIMATAELAT